MTTYAITHPQQGTITYRDRKRWLWLASMVYPLVSVSGIPLYLWSGNEWALLVPVLSGYFGVTAMDWLFGADQSNPPEALVPQLEDDPYYRWLVILTIPMHFIVLLVLATFAAKSGVSPLGMLFLAITAGLYSGLGINTAHELGHKKSALERWLSRIVLAVPAYGHFCVEHNRGHHRYVATPEDPASSKMGENIYAFACREIPGACRRGWQAEKERLQRTGQSVWSLDNEILQSYALSAVLQVSLIAALGWVMVPFLLIHNFYAWWQLTSANYIEHYGLLRAQDASGRYEHCQPHHSWNANHVASNLLLFHLERHSDHHAHPTRRYQSLRAFPNLPELPTGYFGMFLLALFPPLWYRVMDRRLLALPHIRSDFNKINVLPARRAELVARYAGAFAKPVNTGLPA
ncbi:MAG: alkane 1-monooxygenase [Rhodocyclaceae bacterium]|nr:alkane 1-monooxygenase [Rhodocyclaceae bacterium]